MSLDDELQDLLQFLYQCPVGIVETNDAGVISKINPAATNLLAGDLDGDPLANLFPVLRRRAPDVLAAATGDAGQLGRIGADRRLIAAPRHPSSPYLEFLLVRVNPDQLMFVLLDVTEERRLSAREHQIALDLQRAMLGHIDSDPSGGISALYLASDVELEVGGDWYDAIGLPDGRIGLAVGDVTGHDLRAAIAMGQIRTAMRALAPTHPDPADLLDQLDRSANSIDGAACTTVAYAVIDSATGQIEYACAGHPPPLLVRADGTADFLEEGRGLPLATDWPVGCHTAYAALRPADTLVLYTDGLIERRTVDIDEQFARLKSAGIDLRGSHPLQLSSALARALTTDGPTQDDICILTLRHQPEATAHAKKTGDSAVVAFSPLNVLRNKRHGWNTAPI